MAHPFLPKMKSGTANRFPVPAATGSWDERPASHLAALADAIEIPPGPHGIHSIPDPWARALLFDRALFDKNHSLHEAVRGEWRGLIAVMALKECRGFDGLSARAVSPSAASPGTFSSVIASLMPSGDGFISPVSNWSSFHILRWQKQPFVNNRAQAFAFTSPTTLVATGADYADRLDLIPWYDGVRLVDPIPLLSGRERRALAEWLLVVSQKVPDMGGRTVRGNLIVNALNEFAAALDPGAQVPQQPASVFSPVTLGIGQGIFQALDQPRASVQGTVTDVQIVTSKPNAPVYVLIEPTLAQQWNKPARDITVYGNTTLETSNRLTSTRLTSDEIVSGVRWCTPEFFFADRVIYDPTPTDAFPGCLKMTTGGSPMRRSAVFPLRPEVLTLFTPQEIRDNFSLSWLANGGVTCTFNLRLRSSAGTELPCQIQRTYDSSELVEIESMPMVGIWPNFRLPDWRCYHLFQLWNGERHDELSVTPWAEAEPEPQAQRLNDIDGKFFQIYRTGQYPEVLICETPYTDTIRRQSARAKGLLLLNLPKPEQPPAASSTVLGIDFGSTGTNIYEASSGEPKPLLFQPRIRQITDFDPGDFQYFNSYYFIPSDAWSAENVLSLFHDFGDPPNPSDKRLAVRDGHVLYTQDPGRFMQGDRRRVQANLKWGEEREQVAAHDFLTQLCIQAAAELAVQGVKTVDIRFSYPTAFSKPDIARWMGSWNLIVKGLAASTGIRFQLNPTRVDNREAIAATKFFCDYTGGERMDITGGAITIDIGGGTSDIAVWNDRALLSHSSVIFAGRDIILAAIRQRPEILNQILPDIRLEAGHKDAAFNAQLDVIMARQGARLIEELNKKQNAPAVRGLLGVIETGLCGLAFYTGLMVRRLLKAGAYTKTGRPIPIFVGGNGSNMFLWCGAGYFDDYSEIHEHFANAFLAGAGLTDAPVEVHLSQKPKSEVAYGLVSAGLLLKVSEDFATPFAGENFRMQNEQKCWDEAPTAEAIFKGEAFADRGMPVFTEFLNVVGPPSDKYFQDKLGGYVDLRFAQLAQQIANAKKADPQAPVEGLLRNEPIFIIALKRLMEIRIQEWSRAATR